MIVIDKVEFGPPAPSRFTLTDIVFTAHFKTALCGFTLRKQDGVVHVEVVDPGGLELLCHGVECDHLFARSRLVLDAALIRVTEKTAVKDAADLAAYRRFVGELVRLEPCPA